MKITAVAARKTGFFVGSVEVSRANEEFVAVGQHMACRRYRRNGYLIGPGPLRACVEAGTRFRIGSGKAGSGDVE